MIVLQIHVDCIALGKAERDAPISQDRDRIEPLQATDEAMKLVARQIHVLRPDGGIQSVKNAADTVCLLGIDAFALALCEVALKPFMAEALDHL